MLVETICDPSSQSSTPLDVLKELVKLPELHTAWRSPFHSTSDVNSFTAVHFELHVSNSGPYVHVVGKAWGGDRGLMDMEIKSSYSLLSLHCHPPGLALSPPQPVSGLSGSGDEHSELVAEEERLRQLHEQATLRLSLLHCHDPGLALLLAVPRMSRPLLSEWPLQCVAVTIHICMWITLLHILCSMKPLTARCWSSQIVDLSAQLLPNAS